MQKGNCFLSSVLCFVFDSFVQAQHLFAFNSLFYADKNVPRECFGLEGISKDHPFLDLPRSSCCTIQAQTFCYCGAVDFLWGCGKESWCWNAVGTLWLHHSLPSSAVGFRSTRIPSPNQVFNFSTLSSSMMGRHE